MQIYGTRWSARQWGSRRTLHQGRQVVREPASAVPKQWPACAAHVRAAGCALNQCRIGQWHLPIAASGCTQEAPLAQPSLVSTMRHGQNVVCPPVPPSPRPWSQLPPWLQWPPLPYGCATPPRVSRLKTCHAAAAARLRYDRTSPDALKWKCSQPCEYCLSPKLIRRESR